MATKSYQLNIAKSDGTNETVSFVIPDTLGTYKLKFTLSDGQEIDAGNITVDDVEHSYELKLTLSDGRTINAGTIVTPAGIIPEIFTFSETSTAATVTGLTDYGKTLSEIVIPNEYNEKPVTSIGDNAFQNGKRLTGVTIPSSVTSIGNYAFRNCSGLTSVTVPSSVTSIGSWAFYGCSGLTSITIPSGVTSIGSSAFRNCSGLTSITIPSSVTSINSYAFQDCSSLASINYSGTIEQWQTITKGYYWDIGTGDYTVYCTDGNISTADS